MTVDQILENPETVAALIDHTLLKPDATEGDIERLCHAALEWHFASVCVNPFWVATAAREVRDSGVRVCSVAGFPLGANETVTKAAEAARALDQGAAEIDMVLNVGALRSGHLTQVGDEIAALARLVHSNGAILKVILETCLLTDAQKVTACQLAVDAAADFVKTSTGFSSGGATASDVKLMFETVAGRGKVKASGGVRRLQDLQVMVRAGAQRIGTSAGVSILAEVSDVAPNSGERGPGSPGRESY